jgi:hypothetical protein
MEEIVISIPEVAKEKSFAAACRVRETRQGIPAERQR